MRIALFISAFLLTITGCQTMTPQEAEILRVQISQPTIKMECPPQGCILSNFEYHDPNRQIRMPTNVYDLGNTLVGSLTNIVAVGAPLFFMSKAFKYMNSSTTTTTTTSDSSQANQSYDYSQANTSSDSSQANTTTTSTNTTTSNNTTATTTTNPYTIPEFLAAPK